ncbi:ribonuclease III [candidate division WOR-3 bacterium]|nr:ribonuclease III [candidate division WOR-3 bacterium]
MRSHDYKEIEQKLKIRFTRRTVLKKALTHSSYSLKYGSSNEVLEFLGDAVLELVTREYLWEKSPAAREGELSEHKKNYTSTEALYHAGRRLGIGRYIFMSKGERASGGQTRPSIIAGTLEALIGALYIDRGLPYTRKFITRILLQRKRIASKDHKSLLNQWAMKHHKHVMYHIAKETGPPHQRTFRVHLFIDDKKKTVGIGRSKKDAEQKAAEKYLKKTANRRQ